MKTPLADKRPIGPFRRSSSSLKTVLITTDFFVDEEGTRLSRDELIDRLTNPGRLGGIVSDKADEYFSGEVTDVRAEDHIGSDRGKVSDGIRVVYDTQINAVYKENIDNLESDLQGALGEPVRLAKVTVVASDR